MGYKFRFTYLSLLLALFFCFYANFAWALPEDLTVKFLDIGQGDSILITTPNGRNIIIDGGPSVTVLERLGEETSFWLKDIDLVILTHPDLDHLEGLLEIVKRYQVNQVLLTGAVHNSSLYDTFLETVQKENLNVSIADTEQDWLLDQDLYLDILAPNRSVALDEVDNANDASVVAKLIYRGTSLMLAGDAEHEEEYEMLMTDYDLRSNILKAGHHGSQTSSSIPFLRAVQADVALFSSGKDNSFNHPHLETVLRFDEIGLEWRNTKDEGTVTLRSDGSKWY